MMKRLAFPLTPIRGRLGCLGSEAEATLQLLGWIRDIDPGDFLAFPRLGNPFDQMSSDARPEDLAEALEQLLRALGPEIRVVFDYFAAGERVGDLVLVGGEGASRWTCRVPLALRLGTYSLLLSEARHGSVHR